MARADQEAALAAASDILAPGEEEEQSVEAEAEATEQSEGAAAEEESQHEADESEDELSDEMKALLEEPDFEAEVEAELDAVEPEAEVEDDDAEKRELKKRALMAEKKAAHYEKLRAQSDRRKWETEANKYFPYADASKIEATSHRAFLRKAKAEHEAIKERVDSALAKNSTDLEAAKAEMEARIRAELEAAWGKPTTGPGVVPVEAVEASEKVDRAIQERGLAAGIKEWMKG